MPCTLTGSIEGDTIHFLQEDKRSLNKELLKTTQLLCLVCKTLEKNEADIPDKLMKWWKAHKFQDRTRGLPKYK